MGKKSNLTRGLESGIFRIHIRYSISAKKGKQQNTSKLKYQCICTPYSWLIKISNCSTSIFHTVKQCFFCFMHFLICSENASFHVLRLWALNNFFIKSNFLLSQLMLQYLSIQPFFFFFNRFGISDQTSQRFGSISNLWQQWLRNVVVKVQETTIQSSAPVEISPYYSLIYN